MTQKFYLHVATTTDTGTLPGATSVSATTPTVIGTGGTTNRAMDGSIGTSQGSNVLTTNAVTTTQSGLIGRWCSNPIAAQTLSAATVTFREAYSESNTNSAFVIAAFVIVVWRPSTGALVGRFLDHPTGSSGFALSNVTVETDTGVLSEPTTTAQTSQDGDILVLEAWRGTQAQGMATAYTNTIWYDGTTEGSATTNAAYVSFASDIAMQVARTPYTNPMPQLIAQ